MHSQRVQCAQQSKLVLSAVSSKAQMLHVCRKRVAVTCGWILPDATAHDMHMHGTYFEPWAYRHWQFLAGVNLKGLEVCKCSVFDVCAMLSGYEQKDKPAGSHSVCGVLQHYLRCMVSAACDLRVWCAVADSFACEV